MHLLLIALLMLSAPASAALPAEVDGQALPSLAPMLERVMPAVVNINTRTRVRVRNPLLEDPFFRHFFDLPMAPQERIEQSLGSGVIIDAERGLVLTNHHVIAGADDISVTLLDGRTLQGERVGSDPDTDVALLRIPAEQLTALPLADASTLRVGDFVVAVGNPFGLGQTVTSGIVSALGRSGLRGLSHQNFIQTDASINPGNSGGALVNLRGELVGINTAIFTPSGGNVGIGFAIPADLARVVTEQILTHGRVRRGSLGVETQDLSDELRRALGLQQRQGAVITRVQPGSAAAQAGLRPGDVIVAINGRAVRNAQDFSNQEAMLPLETPLELRYLRENRARTTRATLSADSERSLPGDGLHPRLTGVVFAPLADAARQRGLSGVQVARIAPRSRAAQAGLQPGDVVVAVNGEDIASLADLEAALARPGEDLLLTIVRGRRAFLLPL